MEENLLETQEELELFQFIVVRLGDEQYGINIQ